MCHYLPLICRVPYSSWIVWNLILAFIPLVLSLGLFRYSKGRPGAIWWLGFLAFAAFLPNAPYMLTDIIHTIQAARSPYSIWVISLLFIPLHVVAIVSGFEAYVISLINLGHYFHKWGQQRWIGIAELLTHLLCAIGIYIGRFDRLNSWEFLTDPTDVLRTILTSLTSKWPVLIIAISALIITISYWVMKQITLGIVLRLRQLKADRREQQLHALRSR
jgi:uncharacterized membrane protein